MLLVSRKSSGQQMALFFLKFYRKPLMIKHMSNQIDNPSFKNRGRGVEADRARDHRQKRDQWLSGYLSRIGRKGGRKSRRRLSADQARQMVRLREAQRAYKKYHARCFWSYDPECKIGPEDIGWVSEQLMKNGDRELWLCGAKLCL